MRKIFLALLFLFSFSAMGISSPVDMPCGWQRTAPIVIVAGNTVSNVTGAIGGGTATTGFPVLVTLPTSCITSGGPYACQSDGGDLRFSSDSLGLNLLNCEVLPTFSYTNPLVFVGVPIVNYTSTTTIYVWYHYMRGTIAQPPAGSPGGAAAVWDSHYDGVWHLQNPGTVNQPDSTAHTNTMNLVGTLSSTNGKFGNALQGYSATSWLSCFNGISETGNCTISAWGNCINTSTTGVILGNTDLTNNYCQYQLFLEGNPPDTLKYVIGYAGTYSSWVSNSPPLSGVNYIVSTSTGVPTSSTAVTYYLNNATNVALQSYSTANSTMPSGSQCANPYIGARPANAGTSSIWQSWLQEVRISNVIRSTSWIASEYANQNSPSTYSTSTSSTFTAWWQSLGFFNMVRR